MKGTKQFSRQANLTMLGIVTAVLSAFVGLSYHQWDRYRSANAEAQRSHAISNAIEALQSDVVDAETGQRGFLLTGQDRYLDPYTRAIQAIPKDLATLKELLQGRDAGELGELQRLTQQKLDELRATIEVRKAQGMQAATAVVLTDAGMRTMNALRTLCAHMEREEGAHETQVAGDGEAAAGMALLITVAGALVLLFLFAFGFEPFASSDPHAWHRPWTHRYGAAVLSVVAVTLIRASLTPLMGPISMPFTLYYCAVLFAAWFGGFRPAVVSIVLSLVAGSWLFAAPTHSLLVSGHDDQVAMLLLVLVGYGAALLSRAQRTAVERAVRAENAERVERERFETTLTSIGDAVVATDAQGLVTFQNQVASALTGWPVDEARGVALHKVFHIVNEVTRAVVESPVDRVLREGQVVGLANHTILIGKDGSEVAIDDSAAPIRDAKGEIQGAVLVFRDVSERRETERRLIDQATQLERAAAEARAQRQRLGLALTAGKMGAYEVDAVERAFWWSQETYALFGVSPAEFKPTRESFAALIRPGDRETFMQYWDENLASFQPINHEFRIETAEGKERWISCRGIPNYDDSGAPAHYSGLFVDVTERKEAEQMLRKFEKLSAAARLSAAIAHEINNPLGAVTNLIYLAKEMPGIPAGVVEHLTLAEQELERVAHAVRQALGFYRESARAEQLEIEELLESVVKIFSNKIAEKNIKIVRGFAPCRPVRGVRGEIRQVISNVLANAIEAVADGGTIWLGAQPVDAGGEQAVQIIIADDGHGIAAEHLGHIFEPFFTTKAGTGTGLGLWAAREIVERHLGHIEVEQTESAGVKRGTTFTITLPGEAGGPPRSPAMKRDQSVRELDQNL